MKSIQWRLGTMGFSYSDWRGVFYPAKMNPSNYLSFYARHYNAIELDTTFYATPPIDRVKRWRDVTPDDFGFTAKAPKLVTHALTLENAIEPMIEFLKAMRHLGSKLGVILFQFPPSFGYEHIDRLRDFLRTLPTDIRYAVELRDRSWGREETLTMLREQKVGFCSAEYHTQPSRIPITTDFIYLRLIGQHQRFKELDHEQIDVTEPLTWWADEVRKVSDELSTIWGFFNNDYAGYAPATCNRFKTLIGLPTSTPADPAQGRLF
ncbi:MAG TPA: DUF72 domain-containing protein [Tepidisphaeraceae bacterium]|jgi:uncharacterized protein YecE (DUF72 family)|nr:DUF72 domain-containing protein [Tepidisphaeraceae bacterium]